MSSETRPLVRRDHLLLVLCVVGVRLLVARCCPTYDDAFITYRYAQNLAAGRGFVFNPGEAWEPVLGITTPLYGLFLTGLAALGANLVSASLYLNVACDAATALLLPRLVGGGRARAIAAIVAFAALPASVRITVGGMESPLFALCGVAAAVAWQDRRPFVAGVAAAATCLVRPEGVLLVGAIGLAWLLRGASPGGPRARRPRDLVLFLVPVAFVGLVAIAWLTHVYGSPIPHSVTAKSTVKPATTWPATLKLWDTILRQSFLPHTALIVVLPLTLVGLGRALREGGALRILSFWALGITASYLAARPHTWGWYFYVPLVAWACWTGVGAAWALEHLATRVSDGLARVAASVAVPGSFVLLVGAAAWAGETRPTPVNERVYAPMRAWAEATSRAEPSARILASDIGAIGWWWHGTVLDSAGLVWPEALRLPSHEAIVTTWKPEYVLLQIERFRLRAFRSVPEIAADYEAIARFSVTGETVLEPRLEDVDVLWSQDYVVYRRRAR